LLLEMLDEDKLTRIAEECRRQVVLYGDSAGIGPSDLTDRVPAYKTLDANERAWVQVRLCKMRDLAVSFGAHHAARFYPRSQAPEGAFNIAELPKTTAEVVARAIRETFAEK
jgi:hypothetical protein